MKNTTTLPRIALSCFCLWLSCFYSAQAQYEHPPTHQLNVSAGGTASQLQTFRYADANSSTSVSPSTFFAPFISADYQQSWVIGSTLHHRQSWVWSAGLAYTAFGANENAYGDDNAAVPFSTSYLTLPIMTGFQFQSAQGATFSLKGGVELCYALDPYTPELSTTPWGNVNAIADLQVGFKRFFIGVRPQIGLTNYRRTEAATYRHLGVTVYVGASFIDTRYKSRISSSMWSY